MLLAAFLIWIVAMLINRSHFPFVAVYISSIIMLFIYFLPCIFLKKKEDVKGLKSWLLFLPVLISILFTGYYIYGIYTGRIVEMQFGFSFSQIKIWQAGIFEPLIILVVCLYLKYRLQRVIPTNTKE